MSKLFKCMECGKGYKLPVDECQKCGSGDIDLNPAVCEAAR